MSVYIKTVELIEELENLSKSNPHGSLGRILRELTLKANEISDDIIKLEDEVMEYRNKGVDEYG